jgi:hypothetical protein
LAKLAAAHADVVCRLPQQATLVAAVAGRVSPVAWASRLATVQSPLLEHPLLMGATEPVAARLMAARVPEAVVHARRRRARKNAKKRGYTPAHAPVTRVAWTRFIPKVPETIWPTATVLKVYPLRWQVELILQSWQSSLHVAGIKTTTEDTT